MRFREKLKFFVFGGCFVALGVALTYLTGNEATGSDLVGDVKHFDSIVCKNFVIKDDNDKIRMLLSARVDNTPTIFMHDSKGEVVFIISGDPPSLVVGRLRGDHVLIDTSGVARGIDGKGDSKWP